MLHLRLAPAKNSQLALTRDAAAYLDPTEPAQRNLELTMEPAGFEPATSDLQNPRSPN